jgi:hypothetical protein
MIRRSLASAWIAAGAATLACRVTEVATAAPPVSTPPHYVAPPSKPESAPPPASEAAEAVVVVADPALLRSLESQGYDAGSVLAGGSADSTNSLARTPGYRTVVDTLARDLAADRRADPSAGVGMRFSHRQFDLRWLVSEKTRFDLIGVVNRLDRRPFASAHCGEVRFVYRLAYRVATAAGPVDSRLPMTVNAVSFQEPDANGSCRDVARSWLRPPGVRERGGEGTWLVSGAGPLSAARRASFKPKSVEVNFQSVRWPSTVRPAMAGHAEYVLRVFHRTDAAPFLVPAPLENTLDVPRLEQSRALRDELTQWIRSPEALTTIDAGTPLIPEKFLALRAVSVSPHGLARRANRLYRIVVDPATLASPDLSAYSTIQTPEALVRRLDALSCPGCHQSRGIAGFHLLGVEPSDDKVDAIEVPMSPHFHAELERRRPYVVAVAEGRAPDERRPSPEHAAHDDGVGARCGLGNAGFAAWTCAAGLRCVRHFDDEVGECEAAAGPSYGDGCESGSVTVSENPHRDTARLNEPVACANAGVCEANSVGFPGGMCSGACGALPPGATCGGIAILTEFNSCLAAGTPFDRCIADHTRPGALRSCGFHTPCRDDYVCARGPSGGVCMPPYFLFQLRVDGHPL